MNEKVLSLISELSKSGIPAIVIVLEGDNSKLAGDFDSLPSEVPDELEGLKEPTKPVNPFSEVPEKVERALFNGLWRELKTGTAKTVIIEETLGCKGRNYRKGQQWFDYLMNKYGE